MKASTKAALKKINYQTPDTVEARLFFAVFSQAVRDGDKKNEHQLDALYYLNQKKFPHLEYIGIDTDYAKRVLLASGFKFNPL